MSDKPQEKNTEETTGLRTAHVWEPNGNGVRQPIDDRRAVSIFPGKNNEFMLVYENDGREMCVRLTREGALATLVLLIRHVSGAPADERAPISS